jgi:two-component system chemotaxis sensor kinase CheA
LKEPLLHLVRNAFSHGIESPEQRTAARKPAEGTIVLRAEPQGDAVVITIADDGAGVDVDGVLRRAQAAGLPMPTIRDEAGILELLCAPGLSTRDEADRSAGRGVGMSVVRTTLQQIGGQLSLQTKRGVGTTFTLRVPLTLSILDTIIVTIGTHTCAIPQTSILEMVQIASDVIRPLGSTDVIPYRDGVLPVTRLRKVFNVAGMERPEASVVVVNSERGAHGLVVDRIHTQKEVVLRPMKDPLLHVAGLYGATELGDGKPVLILDPFALTNGAVRPPAPEPEPSSSPV